MVSALTANSSSLLGGGTVSSTDQLYQQMQSRVSADIQARTAKINDDYTHKSDVIGAKEDQLIKVKGSMMNANSAYENALESLDDIDSTLLSLRSTITNAQDGAETGKTDFNFAILSISNAVNSYSSELNPVGNLVSSSWEGNTISYRTDEIVGKRNLTGTFAGTDFKITTADGTIWRPEDGTSVLQKFDADGTLDENFQISMFNGVQLDAYNADTGEVTISMTYAADQPPTTITGTLERGGLEIMPAWFYRSQASIDAGEPAFSRAEDFDAARADVEKAVRKAQAARAIVEGGKAQIKSDMGKMDLNLSELTSEKRDALETSLNDRVNLQTDVQSQYQVMLLNLSRASSVQQQYANIFAGVTARNPFLSVTT